MYFITVLEVDHDKLDVEVTDDPEDKMVKSKRCWGYFSDKETARKAIMENWTDMYEMASYNLAVIEEIPEGIPAWSNEETWFKVEPIYNPEELERHIKECEERKNQMYFGKKLGLFLHRAAINQGMTLAAGEHTLLCGSLRNFALPDMEWTHLLKIQNADAAPDFTPAQWDCLIAYLNLSSEEHDELIRLQVSALEDQPAKVEILSYGKGSFNSPVSYTDTQLIEDYKVTEIEKPNRFSGVVGWSLG